MKLPPLPRHTISGPPGSGVYFDGHTDETLRDFGILCVLEGLELAAKECDKRHLSRSSPADCAEAIRKVFK
jgi:hypothetical protein